MQTNGNMLTGTAVELKVKEHRRGRKNVHIAGSPFTPHVRPAVTHPRRTIAYGVGLVKGEAGQVSRFTIQSKDDYGNDREEGQALDAYTVTAYIPSTTNAEYNGTVTYEKDGRYAVEFTPEISGEYTVVVSLRTKLEVQTITTKFD